SSGVTTSGTTFKTEPSNQPTSFVAGVATTSNIPLSWTAASTGSQSPDGYLIKGSATSLEAISDPLDGVDSSSDTSFSDGSVIFKTTSSSYSSFSNYTVGTMYYYKIYSFTNTTTFSTSPNVDYKTDNVPTLYHATLPAANTTLEFSNTTSNTTTITWIQPATYSNANHSTLVFIKAGSAVTVGTPTSSPSSYSANATFALGTTYQNDISAYCIYKGDLTNVTVHGLDGNTNYHVLIVTVVDATNSNGKNSYSTTLTSNKTTLCNAVDTFNLDFEGTTSLPQCTSFLSSDNLGANINNEPYGGLKSLGLQNSTTFILPFVTNAHLNTHYINFYARTLLNVTGQIGFGYLTNPSDATTYVNLETFDLNSTYKLCTYTPTNIPENAYIAIKLLTSSVLRIDNIVWEAVPLSQISSSLTASGTVGSNFQYDIIASNNPTSYATSGLPAGLSIDTTTGVISGTPTESGVFLVVISATNGGGTSTETLEITILPSSQLVASQCGATFSFDSRIV
ncbi:MAG: Ig domain-containing protein, partial [Dolichospermum sp.]